MTHYETLRVARNAPIEDVRKAWRREVLHHHPDALASRNAMRVNEKDGEATIRAINEAWSVLKDPGMRAAYDSTLGSDGEAYLPKASTGTRFVAANADTPFTTRPQHSKNKFPIWGFIVLGLVAMIIVSAFARRSSDNPKPANNFVTTTVASLARPQGVVGSCLFREGGKDRIDSCTTIIDGQLVDVANNGEIRQVVGSADECATGLGVHRLVAMSTVLCIINGHNLNNGVTGA